MNCVGVDDVMRGDHFPIIGNDVVVGIGAHIIGAAQVPDDTIVAAGAVVVHVFEEKRSVLVGVPASIKISQIS